MERGAALWEEIGAVLRTERSRRNSEDFAPLAVVDVAEVQRAIEEADCRFVPSGDWAEAMWARVTSRFEAHRPYLRVVVPKLKQGWCGVR
ncbi:MAG: hypothetical protein ACYDFT_03665 [Thermoplasmata archaeon]